jgi:hypothetical protein
VTIREWMFSTIDLRFKLALAVGVACAVHSAAQMHSKRAADAAYDDFVAAARSQDGDATRKAAARFLLISEPSLDDERRAQVIAAWRRVLAEELRATPGKDTARLAALAAETSALSGGGRE